jgi:DNA-binding CsgD family transcriptional regulator
MLGPIQKEGPQLDRKLTLHDILTPKQFRVALLLTSGLKNSEIGMILRTTENVIKNILRDIYDRSGCSNRVELALLMVHEAETGMCDRQILGQELATLRGLVRGLDKELALIEMAVAGSGATMTTVGCMRGEKASDFLFTAEIAVTR